MGGVGAVHFLKVMDSLYGEDLAYIQGIAFGGLARGAAPEIVRLLKSANTPVRRVVDLGCGAGVLTSALIEAAFDVTAVDDSAHLLALAAATAPGARFVKASIHHLEIPECEAILAIGEPLTYHPEIGEADCLVWNFFQKAARILPAGGMLIFDIIETENRRSPAGFGGLVQIGPCWSIPLKTKPPARWFGRSKASGRLATRIGVVASFTGFAFSIGTS